MLPSFDFTQHRSFLWNRSWKDDSYVHRNPAALVTVDNARVLFKRKWLEEGRKERGFRKNKHLGGGGGGGAAFSGITKEETLSCKSQGSITAQRRPTQNEGKW